jgi:hypothetical protein
MQGVSTPHEGAFFMLFFRCTTYQTVLPIISLSIVISPKGGKHMSKTKFPKSVSFNLKNEDDKKILKHISRRNFSGYVKKLILADINSVLEKKETTRQQEREHQEPKTNVNKTEIVQNRSASSPSQKSVSVQGRNRESVPVVFSNPLIKKQQRNQ